MFTWVRGRFVPRSSNVPEIFTVGAGAGAGMVVDVGVEVSDVLNDDAGAELRDEDGAEPTVAFAVDVSPDRGAAGTGSRAKQSG